MKPWTSASLVRTSLFAAAVLAAGAASAANLVANGSFEAPDIVGGSYALYAGGSNAITGWTVVAAATDSVQLTPDTYLGLLADDGRQWVDLTGIYGYDKGLRSDAFATTAGATYRLSFAVGNYIPFGPSTVGLSIAGGAEQWFTNRSLDANPKSPMNWATFSVDWVAAASSATLTFVGRANGALSNDGGIGLDNVVVEQISAPVPEPGSWALLLAGAAALALHARRRRR